jgi:hypothetical protein
MFQQEVLGTGRVTQNRIRKPNNITTCIQAEVLVKDHIAYDDILTICFRDATEMNQAKQVAQANGLPTDKFKIYAPIFEYHSEWIVRGGPQPVDTTSWDIPVDTISWDDNDDDIPF